MKVYIIDEFEITEEELKLIFAYRNADTATKNIINDLYENKKEPLNGSLK